MRLLLDTHVAIWFIMGNEKLSRQARTLILDTRNDVYVSVVSLIEIAIKNSVRREGPEAIGISMNRAKDLFDEDFAQLAITPAQIVLLETMPRHHNDPFDRLLIAQAQVEQMHLVTAELRLAEYGEVIMLV